MKQKQELQKYSEIGFPLNVYAFITYFETGEFSELHYGLFNSSSDDLLQAQKNSTDLLFKYLYKSPAKVLEVGIGLGKTHQKLIDKGFDCVGITPDNAQIEIVKESIPEANLHCVKFEDFTDEKNKYDLVLFQESAQYISPDDIFSQCQKLLSESGRILIVDEFSIGVEHLHNIEKFKEKAEEYGFHVNSFIDLSEQAKPTEDYLLEGLNKYRDEFIKQLNLDIQTMDHLIEAVHEHKEGYEKKERGYFFLELAKRGKKPFVKQTYSLVHSNKMDLTKVGLPNNFDLNRDFEPKETQLVRAVVKRGDIVFDIGANIGYYTLQFADLVGCEGKIFAFEPDTTNYALLEKHIEINQYTNVVPVKKAISSKNEKGKLFLHKSNIGMHRVYDSTFSSDDFINIEMIDLDTYFESNQKIDFIKIDIEGYEYQAFLGMQSLLKENLGVKIMMEFAPIALWEAGTDPVEMITLLEKLDFSLYSIENNLESIDTNMLKNELNRISETIKSFLKDSITTPEETEKKAIGLLEKNAYYRGLVENIFICRSKYYNIEKLKKKLGFVKKQALILTSLPLSNVGGIEKINQNIKILLEDYNWDVKAISTQDIRKTSVGKMPKRDGILEQYFSFSSEVAWKSYDLVITNNYTGGLCYSTGNTRVVRISHGIISATTKQLKNFSLDRKLLSEKQIKLFKLVEEGTYVNSSEMIAVSSQVQQELKEIFDTDSTVIVNGFDFDKFSKVRNDFREQNDIPADAFVGIYAARMDPLQKRPNITIELAKKFPEIYWIFATDKYDPQFKSLKNIIPILNVPYDEMPIMYSAADFSIQLSLYEGFSNFALETIACKIPMISTKTGIITEVYKDTKLDTLLIDQSFDESIILQRASEKVQLLKKSYNIYKLESENVWIKAKVQFSLEKWNEEMLYQLDPHTKFISQNKSRSSFIVKLKSDQNKTILTKKDMIDNIESFIKAQQLNKAKMMLYKVTLPWDKSFIELSIQILIEENTIQDREYIYFLFEDFLQKSGDKSFFYKYLTNTLFKMTTWTDLYDPVKTSVTMDLLAYISHFDPKLSFSVGAIGRIIGKHINRKKYKQALNLLENIEYTDNSGIAWMDILVRIKLGMNYEGISEILTPNDCLLENTIFHFRNSSSKCFIYFVGHDADGQGIIIEILQNILKEYNISLMVVIDPDINMSLTGLGSLDLNESIAAFQNELQKLDYEHVVTFSSSGPGFAALIYGLKMNIDGVWGVNILTKLSIKDIVGDQDIDAYYEDICSNMLTLNDLAGMLNQKYMDEFCLMRFGKDEFPDLDAKDYLHKNIDTLVMLHYSKNFEPDKYAAERLKDFRNVHIVPVEHDNHFLLLDMYRQKKLKENFELFFRYINWI